MTRMRMRGGPPIKPAVRRATRRPRRRFSRCSPILRASCSVSAMQGARRDAGHSACTANVQPSHEVDGVGSPFDVGCSSTRAPGTPGVMPWRAEACTRWGDTCDGHAATS